MNYVYILTVSLIEPCSGTPTYNIFRGAFKSLQEAKSAIPGVIERDHIWIYDIEILRAALTKGLPEAKWGFMSDGAEDGFIGEELESERSGNI